MISAAVRYKFTVHEYDRMAEAGIFHEDDRVELIEGEIVRMSAVGNRHIGVVNRLNALLAPLAVSRRAIVSVQNPVVLSEYSEPQPDITLLAYDAGFYTDRKPAAKDVLLLVEVADSSLDYDRLTKVPLYARSGIPEVWLIDLPRERIEVYRKPEGDGFRDQKAFERGDTIAPQAFSDLETKVQDVIG